MTKLQWALRLASQGFWVFRLKPNGKLPFRGGWQTEATRDPDKIHELFKGRDFNIGIFTSKYQDDRALIVIDEDNKNGKNGAEALFQLDFSGMEIPHTRIQTTLTGGRHHIYSCDRPLKQGANVLGEGLDIRSRGGYIVAAGSSILGAAYRTDNSPIVDAPEWITTKLNAPATRDRQSIDTSKIDPQRALDRAMSYLETAPVAEEGGRNDMAFRVTCEVKDRGVDEVTCLELISEWNELHDVPLEPEELEIIVNSAYKSGQNSVGSRAAEALFSAQELPEISDELKGDWFDQLNAEYALVVAGGAHHILWETKDAKGNYRLEHLNEASFHRMLAYRTVEMGTKSQAQTKIWMSDKSARRYDGLTFAPEQKTPPKFFNMWRGFAVEPVAEGEVMSNRAHKALKEWLAHGLDNVCNGDPELHHWLLCRFAHMIQKPWEKALTAVVFKGEKGVGKNVAIMFVNKLLGHHALTTAKKRYLTGNFNAHFEACLSFTLDEAMWGGDKDAEGALKDLITGYEHFIEMKGKEGFTVPNLTSIFILGNEGWLVPASFDERRFAVFIVGNGRKQDNAYFEEMKNGMNEGGLRLLLTFLKNYDMRGTNINVAPYTQGLVDQKISSLEPIGQWWFDCLSNGELLGAAMTGTDFTVMSCAQLRKAMQTYFRERNISRQSPSDETIGRELKKMAPSMTKKLKYKIGNQYHSAGLTALRKDFEKYIKGEIKWSQNEEESEDAFQ